MTDLDRQLSEELNRALVSPVTNLLGIDLGEMLRERISERSRFLTMQLVGDDDSVIAETAQDIMFALWPHETPDPAWWRTSLGRRIAASYGVHGSEAVTYSVAAAMLGVHRGTVSQLVHRGTLERHPDGGVTRSSVMARLVRLDG